MALFCVCNKIGLFSLGNISVISQLEIPVQCEWERQVLVQEGFQQATSPLSPLAAYTPVGHNNYFHYMNNPISYTG